MSIESFSIELRKLISQYNQQLINFEDYRSHRKLLLDQIDEVYNGIDFNKTQPRSPSNAGQ